MNNLASNDRFSVIAGRAVRFAGLILILLAVSKSISILDGARVLDARDPLFMLSYRSVFTIAIVIEAVVGVITIVLPRQPCSAMLLVGTSGCFMTYRIIRIVMGIKAPCKCMGRFLEWSPALAGHENAISWATLMLLCAIGALGMACIVRGR